MNSTYLVISIFSFLCLPNFLFSQDVPQKGTNTIKVQGVNFKEIGNNLLDAGYSIEKSDSSFQTIKTDFKTGTGKNKWMKIRIFVRIKDSIAIITGEWYNTMFVGSKLFGIEQTIESLTEKIKNTSGNSKACFNEMKEFALSFNKQVEFSIAK